MAVDISFFLAPLTIARRAGVSNKRYVTEDGYVILDSRDVRRIRFTADEMINGIKELNPISQAEAEELIIKGRYKMGEQAEEPVSKVSRKSRKK